MARPIARICGYAWLLLAWCAACDLDPVAKHSLCGGTGPISANCKECQQPPYAAGCPQCIADPNSSDCAMATPPTGTVDVPGGGIGGNISTTTGTPSGGNSPQNPNQSGGSGMNEPSKPDSGSPNPAGGHSGGAQPAGGGNTQPPSSGTAAEGGTGGAPLPPGACRTDADCSGDTPGCLMSAQRCVPCTTKEHCGEGMVCDVSTARCVQCTVQSDCGPDAVCDTTQQRCFQCTNSGDCHDPVKDICSSRRECVDCEGSLGCAAPTPACNGNTCVECTGDNNCSGTKHRCSDNSCVECLVRDNDCVNGSTPVCIVAEQRCVQCIANTDCHDPATARCNSSNTCAGCNADADCARFTDTPVCDTGAHRCVQCNTVNQCGDNACVPSTHSCSAVGKRSLDACNSCESDEQCNSGNCVPMTFSNHDIGSFCLNSKELVASQNCQVNKPFSRTLTNQTTIDGANVTVCAPPDRTTCVGVLDAKNSKSCSSATQCGIGMGLIDSTCTLGRCSYVCTPGDDYECPDSLPHCGQGGQCSLPGN